MRYLNIAFYIIAYFLSSNSANAAVATNQLTKPPVNCENKRHAFYILRENCQFIGVQEVTGDELFVRPIFGNYIIGYRFSGYGLRQPTFPSGTKIIESSFVNGIIEDFRIVDTSFDRVDLSMTSFRQGSLQDVSIKDSDLSFVDFKDTVLEHVNFENVDLFMANIEDLDLSRTSGLNSNAISLACGNKSTILPKGIAPPKHWPCTQAERAIFKQLGTFIISGSQISWHAEDCEFPERDFSEIRSISSRPPSATAEDNWEIKIFSSIIENVGDFYTKNRANDTPQSGNKGNACDKLIIYYANSHNSNEFYFGGRIDCQFGKCWLSGAAGATTPGQIDFLEIALVDREYLVEFVAFLKQAKAQDIRVFALSNRPRITVRYSAENDFAFLSLLRLDPRVWHAARMYDGLGGE